MTDIARAAAGGDLSFLDEEQLTEWVVGQRWFASKAREVAHLNVLEAVPLRADAPLLVMALIEARFQPGTHETYQVPLGLRPVSEGWTDRVIVETDGWTVYDALADPALGRALLHAMRSGDEVAVEDGTLSFHWAESAGAGLGGTVDVRPVGVEQSNSSVVFGDELILKAFRRVEPGVNPELELLRFLSERGFPNIATLAGWYEWEGRLLDATLGILQQFLAGARDGWELALDELGERPRGVPGARALARRGHRRDALGARLGGVRSRVRARGAEHGGAVAAHRDGRRADRARVRGAAGLRRRGADHGPRAGRARAPAVPVAHRRRRQGDPHARRLPPRPDHAHR